MAKLSSNSSFATYYVISEKDKEDSNKGKRESAVQFATPLTPPLLSLLRSTAFTSRLIYPTQMTRLFGNVMLKNPRIIQY